MLTPTRANKHYTLTASAITLFISGCVYTPTSDDLICPGTTFNLAGFAEHAGATLRIEALHDNGTWNTVASAVASTSPFTYAGNTAYTFSTNVTLGSQYFSSFSPDAFATLRVRELGGSLSFLVSFDGDGVSCVFDEVGEGSTWFAAGFNCAGENSPNIVLTCIG